MSDSPLDGGSGWPTSAYAVVPRQPGPTQDAPATPPAAPAEPPPERPEAVPQGNRGWRVAALLIGLIVLVIATVGGVLATRDKSSTDGADSSAVTTPAIEPTTAMPAAAGDPSGRAGGAAASADPSSSGSPGTGILRSGTAQLAIVAGQPDDAYDFDTGQKQVAGADATASALGLSAANGAKFAALPGGDTPSLAACTAVPETGWTGQIALTALVPGSKVCVRTSEGRYAWFMTRAGEAVPGALYSANLDYVVYRKTGD
ncbi:hypothetical protein AB0M46_36790 [Dactylosporangium sp. NPDC051485]|uniref:hypothetical protein n=1 Tax=Dactylosporangium sp. NPDC051485 TaxID=3154846 RepID=UPI00344602E2